MGQWDELCLSIVLLWLIASSTVQSKIQVHNQLGLQCSLATSLAENRVLASKLENLPPLQDGRSANNGPSANPQGATRLETGDIQNQNEHADPVRKVNLKRLDLNWFDLIWLNLIRFDLIWICTQVNDKFCVSMSCTNDRSVMDHIDLWVAIQTKHVSQQPQYINTGVRYSPWLLDMRSWI